MKKPASNKPHHFAEIIESSLNSFLAQCWEWDHFPLFGSLVEVISDECTILGLVTHMQTGSMDPTRYPFPYQKTEEELRAEQPQIFAFLKTTFRVYVAGYIAQETIQYFLPPKPGKIHAFVAESPKETVATFFAKPNFLHLLFAAENHISNLDELLLATFKHLASHNLLNEDKIDTFCKHFSLLTGNDYRRLKLFLGRIQTLI